MNPKAENATYWTYCYERNSPTAPLQCEHTTYDMARATANEWMHAGYMLVHITAVTYTADELQGVTEQLVWAAASAEVDWR